MADRGGGEGGGEGGQEGGQEDDADEVESLGDLLRLESEGAVAGASEDASVDMLLKRAEEEAALRVERASTVEPELYDGAARWHATTSSSRSVSLLAAAGLLIAVGAVATVGRPNLLDRVGLQGLRGRSRGPLVAAGKGEAQPISVKGGDADAGVHEALLEADEGMGNEADDYPPHGKAFAAPFHSGRKAGLVASSHAPTSQHSRAAEESDRRAQRGRPTSCMAGEAATQPDSGDDDVANTGPPPPHAHVHGLKGHELD